MRVEFIHLVKVVHCHQIVPHQDIGVAYSGICGGILRGEDSCSLVKLQRSLIVPDTKSHP